MIIADLSHLESASEVIDDICCGGRAVAFGNALAEAFAPSGMAFSSTMMQTFALSTSYTAVAVTTGVAVAAAVNLPSVFGPN